MNIKHLKAMNRDGWMCQYCGIAVRPQPRCGYTGSECDQATIDHIVPLSLGGSDKASNLRTACRSCNTLKRAKDLDTFRAILRKRLAPSALGEFLFYFEYLQARNTRIVSQPWYTGK